LLAESGHRDFLRLRRRAAVGERRDNLVDQKVREVGRVCWTDIGLIALVEPRIRVTMKFDLLLTILGKHMAPTPLHLPQYRCPEGSPFFVVRLSPGAFLEALLPAPFVFRWDPVDRTQNADPSFLGQTVEPSGRQFAVLHIAPSLADQSGVIEV
jgi:hypothetical protein